MHNVPTNHTVVTGNVLPSSVGMQNVLFPFFYIRVPSPTNHTVEINLTGALSTPHQLDQFNL